MKIGRSVAVLVAAGLVLGGLAVAPAGAEAPQAKKAKKTTFVAAVPGTDAYIGVVVGKQTAVAYFCDGVAVDEWLTGAVSNGVLALEAESGSSLVARVSGSRVRGTIVLADDQALAFDATKAKGKAGVFRRGDIVEGVTLAETWIRLADGTTRGAGGITDGVDETVEIIQEVVVETGVEIVEAAKEVLEDLAEQAGTTPPPDLIPPVPVDPVLPDGLTNLIPDPNLVPPQIPSACPVGLIQIGNVCIELPFIEVAEQPAPDAEPPILPPLEETIAGQVADEGGQVEGFAEARGPTQVTLPAPDAFDAEACERIDRALALLADELDLLDPDDLTRFVFASVFSHLRDRGTLGGCEDLTPAP